MEQLINTVNNAHNIVFFGGAGVSTESGIPDFRSVDGIYNQQYDFPPETILSRWFFHEHTADFYRFYKNKMLFHGAKPNPAHIALAALEKKGVLSAVITQNIDGLHTDAGSKTVYELHGSVRRNYCTHCGKFYGLDYIEAAEGVPNCLCGGLIKPDVVLYGEPLDAEVTSAALEAIAAADVLIVGGTSLNVYPAAGFLRAFKGEKLILINKSVTPLDKKADIVIREPIGAVMARLI